MSAGEVKIITLGSHLRETEVAERHARWLGNKGNRARRIEISLAHRVNFTLKIVWLRKDGPLSRR